jgi:TonB family protein
MTFPAFPSTGSPWERPLLKMIFISLGLHLLALFFFLDLFPRGRTKIGIEQAYFVDLVSSAGEIAGGKKIKEPLAAAALPSSPRTEFKPIPVPKPILKKTAALKSDQAKELERAMEELRNKVQKEKSLETKLNNFEKKAEEKKSLERTFSRLEKKVREEQSSERAPARTIDKKQMPSPVGAGTGFSGAGSISSTVAGGEEGLGIPFQLYLGSLRYQIKKNWGLPEGLLKRDDISAEIIIRISRNGRIEDSRFQRKSGIEAFDQEVLRTLKKSDPLPPLPEGYPKNYYEVVLTFHSKELSGN